ncbi:alcohol dehydrogenase (NADP+) [Aequitasia blattaphilus]|uniref:Aldo/keto reductase n=1 Tax=Aequitasia blattaphilus TaxID=2949332 RepID=A0ABT1E852_9FIRM|nr:aldo/keto reductase [Aequitasia blattaphilus]MCP1101891.1 aldo/keto reductase [Aequitasia blattaphilus]MCR8614531.1 aldo/keto reductase [Aequitasia blattaphilus]
MTKMMKLGNENEIPAIGMGTFGSDRFTPAQVAEAVEGGIRAGYRLIDCASVYGNEKEIGEVFRKLTDEGVVERKDLFIMSKVWNDMHRDVKAACQKTIQDLQCGYLDMYFIHWPFPNYHAPGCDVDARSADSRPFSIDEFCDTYRQIEELYEEGLVKNIGVSNMTIPKFEEVLPKLNIKPAAHEMELHPCFQQEELFNYTKAQGMLPIAYMPMGSPRRPERDIDPNDIADLELPEMRQIAENHGIHPASVALKWAVQRGQLPIPFSTTPKNYQSNLQCIEKDMLTEEEMKKISTLDKGNRLVKGQVFLWEGAKDWHDLWDEEGVIVQ